MGKKERKKAKEHKGRVGQRRPSCLDGFLRLCSDGWLQGWHERNGGNLSYRLAPQERDEFEGYAGFGARGDWHALTLPEPTLAGERFLVTGSGLKPEDVRIFAVGRKGRDALARKGYEIAADHSDVINEPLYSDAMEITRELLSLFEKQEIGEIYLAYTSFKNTVSQIPRFMKLLPVDTEAAELKGDAGGKGLKPDLLLMKYEPDETEVLDAIIPKYVSSLIYGAFLEAVASENGARMTAMDSATNNAEEMIEKLSLQYNRARQGSITQELTEIIAGANAIEG